MPLLPDPQATTASTRGSFRSWLAANAERLEPFRHHHPGDLHEGFAATQPLQQLLFDEGWTRLGWPESVGGLGGSPVQRAVVLEELAAYGYAVPEPLGGVEIIAPMLIRFAPELAAAFVPAGVAGTEVWCQGFSEPDAGSDLASLRTRAVPDGDGYRVTGQKMWSSYGHLARRCSLLARTGEQGSGHRGLTMFWVDLDSPGITVRPTACESGRAEVAELFFDDVVVPSERQVGGVGDGWRAVMYLMQFERGAYAWRRQAELHTELAQLVGALPDEAREVGAAAVGNAYLSLFALRSQAAPTLTTLAGGLDLGPEISIDKLLLSAAEQAVTETARELLWPGLELDDTSLAAAWRRRWAFSRITTIYGGAAEVQRDLVSERLLSLPKGR